MKRFIGCSVMSLVLGGVVLGAIGWAVLSYNVLLREEIRVEASWTRIENVYQSRSSLAELLVDRFGRDDRPDGQALADLEAASERASRLVLSPEVLNEPARFDEIRRADAEQRQRMAEALAELRSTAGPAVSGLDDLEARIRQTDTALDRETGRFNRAVERYNAVLGRFPTSWFARLYRFGPKPRLEPGAAPPGTAVAGPERRDGGDPSGGNL